MKNSTIAYCGVPGSFGHTAAALHFGKDNTFIGTQTFEDVFSLIERGGAEFGVVSLENTKTGPVRENFDNLLSHNIYIVGEEYLPSVHNLLGIPVQGKNAGERTGMIRKVLSHARSLEQCRSFLSTHPTMEPIIFSDTGRAAQYVADKGDPALAAIASAEAGRMYNLDVLAAAIQESSRNMTRYGVLARQLRTDCASNKCSLVCGLHAHSRALCDLLNIIAHEDCRPTYIEQRLLSEESPETGVFLDFEFPKSKAIEPATLFEKISGSVKFVRVLGVYTAKAEAHIQ